MASCPNCGFDLNAAGACPVCGYDSASAAAKKGGEAGGTAKHRGDRARRRGPLLVAGVVVLCAIIGGGAFAVARLSDTDRAAAVAKQPSAAAQAAPSPTAGSTMKAAVSGGGPASSAGGASGAAVADAATAPASTQATQDAPTTQSSLFRFPVGASPVSLRAVKPIDLYDPAVEPVYNLDKRTELPPITSESAYVKWMLAHTDQQESYLRWRWQRAEITVERHLIAHKSTLMAFLLTPREWFVRPYNLSKTYDNTAIPIGYGQTISGPELVAHMTDELDLKPNESVLEIGTGSGYQSAVLSQLSNYVYTIEIVKPLAEQTNDIYLEHTKEIPEYANIHRRLADGYYGWLKYAPFDRIIVTTGIDHIPPDLLKQLKPNGIMLIPIGPPSGQVILKITKTVGKDGNIHLTREDIYHGFKREIFVPFTASGGGTHNTGSTK